MSGSLRGAGGGGGDMYAGYISTTINSCVKNGSSYTINASFTFTSDGFYGAKLPSLTITSSSGGSAYVDGNRYDNDPLVRSFSITANAGDTITISSAYWDDPSDSGSMAYLDSPSVIYTIPNDVVENWGNTWGVSAWGGLFRPDGELKELDISGSVCVAKVFSKDIAGSLRVAKISSSNISGVVRVQKSATKDISGKVRVAGIQTTSISGAVYVDNPNERVVELDITGIVDVLKAGSTTISGKVHIQREEEATIGGQIRVEKAETSDITGIVRVGRVSDVDISGRVRVRVSTPEKLPTDWADGAVAEPENWGDDDKPTDSWTERPEPEADEWSEATKPTDEWDKSADALPVEWQYPLEDTG